MGRRSGVAARGRMNEPANKGPWECVTAYFTFQAWQTGSSRPTTLDSHSVERVASASIFSNFFGPLSRDAPAKPVLCDAGGTLGKERETKNQSLPPLFGKVDDARKSCETPAQRRCKYKLRRSLKNWAEQGSGHKGLFNLKMPSLTICWL